MIERERQDERESRWSAYERARRDDYLRQLGLRQRLVVAARASHRYFATLEVGTVGMAHGTRATVVVTVHALLVRATKSAVANVCGGAEGELDQRREPTRERER